MWDQIPDGVAGSNVDLVISDDDCKIMKLSDERNKSVTEIAALCGYDNPGKFGQSFRMQFGSPPLEYRKNNGRNS